MFFACDSKVNSAQLCEVDRSSDQNNWDTPFWGKKTQTTYSWSWEKAWL